MDKRAEISWKWREGKGGEGRRSERRGWLERSGWRGRERCRVWTVEREWDWKGTVQRRVKWLQRQRRGIRVSEACLARMEEMEI